MDPSAIVVIGASQGGVQAIPEVITSLPGNFPAAVFVVLHIGSHKTALASVLDIMGPLRVSHPRDGENIRAGHVYVAPPDHHMIVTRGVTHLTKGPRENFARPAIDPLFRSAAEAYGPSVVGIILTGGLNDGTAGLYEIKRRGGTAIVQDPAGAENPSMPSNALRHVGVDHCVPLAQMPLLIVRTVDAILAAPSARPTPAEGLDAMDAQFKHDVPVALTCPDCGGALRRAHTGTLTQFKCHIGHVYSAEAMVAGQLMALEKFLEAGLRSLNERADLCRQMAEDTARGTLPGTAADWMKAMQEALDKARSLEDLLAHKWVQPEAAEAQPVKTPAHTRSVTAPS